MQARKSAPKNWQRLAELRLKKALRAAQSIPGIRRLGPKELEWQATVRIVGAAAMTRLNAKYRGKEYATDVLSFEAPKPFRAMGLLGELVICLPVLRRQAMEQGHRPERELEVLLTHGLLHLLGLDHEKGPREAAVMSRAEARLLKAAFGAGGARRPGLIARTSWRKRG